MAWEGTRTWAVSEVLTAANMITYINNNLNANRNALQSLAPFINGFRLSLSTGVPVTTADVTAATTVYLTPFMGNGIALYDGSSAWDIIDSAEVSVSVPSTTTTPFDVFAYNNSGTLTLEALDWTNDTTRATALTTQDGILVKNGATTRRYMGTGRTTGVSGQCEDSDTSRFLWNFYNRVPRFLFCVDTTNSWTYTTATWRAANNNTTAGVGRVEMVIGWANSLVNATNKALVANATEQYMSSGIGIDSTSSNSAQVYGSRTGNDNSVDESTSHYKGYPTIGYHYIQKLEISAASGTTTWMGDINLAYIQTGMVVEVEM